MSHDASDAKTAWDDLTGRFTLTVPRRQVLCPFESIPLFTRQLTKTFEPQLEAIQDPSATPPTKCAVETPLFMDSLEPVIAAALQDAQPSPAVQPLQETTLKTAPAVAATLPDPAALLQGPPYYLTLSQAASQVDVACSHSPSLVLLERYLRQWSPTPRKLPNGLGLTLHECPLTPRLYDGLTIDTHDRPLSLPVVAAIVERSLGYELRHSCGSWMFVRKQEFS